MSAPAAVRVGRDLTIATLGLAQTYHSSMTLVCLTAEDDPRHSLEWVREQVESCVYWQQFCDAVQAGDVPAGVERAFRYPHSDLVLGWARKWVRP